jgi:drug/metabolite transporter (DMT)-like permease
MFGGNVHYYALLVAALMGPAGDFFIKKAIAGSAYYLLITLILWGVVCPLLWYVVYTHITLTKALVIFGPVSMLLTALTGIFVFGETVNARLFLAMCFAVMAVYLGSE